MKSNIVPIHVLIDVLEIPRSTFYHYQKVGFPDDLLAKMNQFQDDYDKFMRSARRNILRVAG